MRSSKDAAIELLKRWKSGNSRIMVVFQGTLKRLNFTIIGGTIADVTEDRVTLTGPLSKLGPSAMLDFSLSEARLKVGSPIEPVNFDERWFTEDLRTREVDVLSVLIGAEDLLWVFELLPAMDVPTITQ